MCSINIFIHRHIICMIYDYMYIICVSLIINKLTIITHIFDINTIIMNK